MMKTLRSDTVGNILNRSRTAIENTLKSPDILALVGPKSYTVTEVNNGKTLLNTATAAVDMASEKSGCQAIASAASAKAFKVAQRAYQDLAKTARATFLRQPEVLTFLGLDKAMPRAEGDFTKAFNTLFNTGGYTVDIRARLATKGYDDAKLSSERAKLSEWQFQNQNHTACEGTAEVAASAQKAALKALVEWVAEYIKIARVALKSEPQLLEKIGVLARNSKTKAQRGAAAKAAATRLQKKSGLSISKAA